MFCCCCCCLTITIKLNENIAGCLGTAWAINNKIQTPNNRLTWPHLLTLITAENCLFCYWAWWGIVANWQKYCITTRRGGGWEEVFCVESLRCCNVMTPAYWTSHADFCRWNVQQTQWFSAWLFWKMNVDSHMLICYTHCYIYIYIYLQSIQSY